MRVVYSPRSSVGSLPLLPWSWPMPVLSWPLYAGGRVRIVPGSAKNGVSGRGGRVEGRGGLWHTRRLLPGVREEQ
jgi:hypothetical protein